MRCCSVFPIRYYIIDFEFSVQFPQASTPDQRVVTGLPALKFGSDHPDDYGRELSPEMLLDKPHCPFKSDVFQLGTMFLLHFHASHPYLGLAAPVINIIAASGD